MFDVRLSAFRASRYTPPLSRPFAPLDAGPEGRTPSPTDREFLMTRCSCFVLLAALALCGCRTRGDVELLESRLRQQEDAIAEMQSELSRARNEFAAAARENDSLRTQLANRGHEVLLPEQADVVFRTASIEVNKLLSGGLDRDGAPGDDLLSVLVAPRDAGGELVKVPGDVRIEALDLALDGPRQRIGLWEFSSAEAAEHWHSGVLGTGYRFQLPWQQPPTSETLLVHARLVTIDGRQFDTTQEIRVTPPEPDKIAGRPSHRAPRVSRTPAPSRRDATEANTAWWNGHDNLPPRSTESLPSVDASTTAPERDPAIRRVSDQQPVPEDDWQSMPPDTAPANPFERNSPVRTSDRWTTDDIPVYR